MPIWDSANNLVSGFAWKAFAQWQQRQDGNEEESKKKKEMFDFMRAFRETFSRPVRRIRFLGLFDVSLVHFLIILDVIDCCCHCRSCWLVHDNSGCCHWLRVLSYV